MDEEKREVLRTHHCLLLKTLDLKCSSVLDELRVRNVLSSDEEEEIMKQGIKRDQNAHLLFILKRKHSSLQPFDSFVTALSGEYEFLVKTLTKQKHRTEQCVHAQATRCTHCTLLKNLNPDDISHYLYQNKVISDEELEEVSNKTLSRINRVRRLLVALETSKDTEHAYERFCECLTKKYEYLTKASNQAGLESYISCQCYKQLTSAPRCNNQNDETGRSFWHKKDFFKDTVPKRSDGLNGSMADFILYRDVPKCILDNALLRRCNHVFRRLFVYREKGEWDGHTAYIQDAWKVYQHQPDVLMVLLRSEMSVVTLYKENCEKADEIYEKAMSLLPKTAMPNWHLVRFLACKVELCTRNKQLNAASQFLEEANQAMFALEPNIGTAALKLFEGMHYAQILRCTNRHTSSSKSLSEKVKTCLLASVKYYQEERYFDLKFRKSFSNQVLVYLALLTLGVDYKKIKYSSISKILGEDDNNLVEFCLQSFEKDWEESTNWSKMLYYVARAEQCKQNSPKRSLECIAHASKYSELGNFDNQKNAIRAYVTAVQDRFNDVRLLEEIETKTRVEMLRKKLESSQDYSS